jgi:phosphoglycolate phosphatase
VGLKKLIKHGHSLALISNKGRQACLKILEHFELEKLFRNVIGGDSRLPLKPAPDTILETMRKTKSIPENTWVIGDNHTDLAAARHAKVKSIFVSYGIGKTGGEKPFLTFDNFNAMVQYFIGI